MGWPNRMVPRADVEARRAQVLALREQGHTWAMIAETLGHRRPQHAWLDAKRGLNMAKKRKPKPSCLSCREAVEGTPKDQISLAPMPPALKALQEANG